MATARDIVTNAARLLRVVAVDEPLDADHANILLIELNSLKNFWATRGIDFAESDFELDDAFTLTVDSTGYADALKSSFEYMLAERAAPRLARPIEPIVAQGIREAHNAVRRHLLTVAAVEVDSALHKMPSQYWGASRYR